MRTVRSDDKEREFQARRENSEQPWSITSGRKDQTGDQPPYRAGNTRLHTFRRHRWLLDTQRSRSAITVFLIAAFLIGKMPSLVRHAIAIVVQNDST